MPPGGREAGDIAHDLDRCESAGPRPVAKMALGVVADGPHRSVQFQEHGRTMIWSNIFHVAHHLNWCSFAGGCAVSVLSVVIPSNYPASSIILHEPGQRVPGHHVVDIGHDLPEERGKDPL